MPPKSSLLLAAVSVAVAEAPSQIQICPAPDADGWIDARDYRRFTFAGGLEACVKRSNRELKKLGPGPVDLNHSMYKAYGRSPSDSEAVGWMDSIFIGDDGALWANVSWLDAGREAIESGKYKYASFVIAGDVEYVWDDEDSWFPTGANVTVDIVEGFGLTNTPANRVRAVAEFEAPDRLLAACKHHGIEDPAELLARIRDAERKATEASAAVADAESTTAAMVAAATDVQRAAREDAEVARKSTAKLCKLIGAEVEDGASVEDMISEAIRTVEAAAERTEAERRESLLAEATKDGKLSPAAAKVWRESNVSADDLERLLAPMPSALADVEIEDIDADGEPDEALKLARRGASIQELAAYHKANPKK